MDRHPYSRWVGALVVLLLVACVPPAPEPARAQPAPSSAGGQAAPAANATASASVEPASASPASPTPALTSPTVVRVGLVGATSDAGIYIALERGYFAAEGLQVEQSQFQSGEQMVPLLGSGQLDVGGGATSAALVNAVARDVPIRIVADKGSLPPGFGYQAVVVRRELAESGSFQGCASFRGMRIANTSDADGARPMLHRLLAECGLALDDIELVVMPNADMAPAFRNGAIDAARMLEPGLSLGLAQGLFAIYRRGDELYPDQQIAVLLYGPQFIAQQRSAAERFMVAYLRGVRDHWEAFTRGASKAEIIDILTRTTVVKDHALFERMTPPGLNPDGYINLQTFADDVEWWTQHGYVRTRVEAERVVDHSFVDYALARLGRHR